MVKPPVRQAPDARLSDSELAPLDESVHIWPGHDVEVDGLRLHVRVTPSPNPAAEPALCVHGLGGSSHNWTDLAGLLRDHLAVEALDLPGHGRSGPGRSYSLQAHADAVIGYLEQSGRGPVHLISNSMGGAISVVVAAQRPDLVRTLTLISPAVPDNRIRAFPLRNDPRTALLVVPGVGELVTSYFSRRYTAEQRIKGTLMICFADLTRYPPARLVEAVAEQRARDRLPRPTAGFLRSMRGLAIAQFVKNRVGWATLRSISVPTLVLWGDTDRLVAPDLAPYVAAAVPDSRLAVFADVGHTAMMEVPEQTARAVLALVEDTAQVRS
ncbi:MAG TPA: alpha/beta fold hydrolase [Jatrophihabitans sp.]|nr:alpha/beta fold hydrolase [Jatrophihabitans sp.]